jgi:hypothetical protein
MPNGQLVEYYLPVRELATANSTVCHELYERWRDRDPSSLTDQELIQMQEDLDQSWTTYNEAWIQYLTRTNQTEAAVESVLKEADEAAS